MAMLREGLGKTAFVATLVLFGIVSAIHTWLGYYPFGG